MMTATSTPDPLILRRWRALKTSNPHWTLLIRAGDFYGLVGDDAKAVSKSLGLTLTQRAEGIPMAVIPCHQLEDYLRRLIQAGFRVAVCDRLEDVGQANERGKA